MKRKFSQFGYDARSELTSATLGNAAYGYGFDEAGNRDAASEAGRQLTYTTNALNQYASVSEGEVPFVPEYDLDGNATRLRTSTGTWSVEYNAHNRPVAWRKSTGEVIYMIYDAQGRRAEKRVLNAAGKRTLRERYVYVGYTCVQVLNGDKNNALVKEFAWDPTEPTATRPLTFRHAEKGLMLFYAFDGNKNVSDVFFLALQNGIGAHYEYAPFGAVTRTAKATGSKVDLIGANPWRFSSEFYDSELGLVYYNYRHYSPSDGRWLSRDPIQEEGGWNLYAFAENAPVVFIDKSGMFSFFPVRGPDFDVSPNASCCLEEKPLWKASGYGSLSECMQDNTNSTKYFGMTCSALCAVKNHLMKIAIGALYTGALVGDILGMNLICRKMICTKIKSPVKNIRRVRRPSGLVRYVYWSCPDKTRRG